MPKQLRSGCCRAYKFNIPLFFRSLLYLAALLLLCREPCNHEEESVIGRCLICGVCSSQVSLIGSAIRIVAADEPPVSRHSPSDHHRLESVCQGYDSSGGWKSRGWYAGECLHRISTEQPCQPSWCMLHAGSRNRKTDVGMPSKTTAKTSTSGGIPTGGDILHVTGRRCIIFDSPETNVEHGSRWFSAVRHQTSRRMKLSCTGKRRSKWYETF